jgi:NAD(P) transhydrogenase subunit alpha
MCQNTGCQQGDDAPAVSGAGLDIASMNETGETPRLTLGVPHASEPEERRVAVVPERVEALVALGLDVKLASGAGVGAGFEDDDYREVGAEVVEDATAWASDIVAVTSPPEPARIAMMRLTEKDRPGGALVGMLDLPRRMDVLEALRERKRTSFALEMVPRISRAQNADALSSQASVAGYWAAVAAAARLPRMCPMLMTAAGTVRPAQVLVIGAGVAGLQAIATAKRLGAQVRAFDVRAAVKEQVESLGARFLSFDAPSAEGEGGYARELTDEEKAAERAMLADAVAASDIVITTALVPRGPAPILIEAETVARMGRGTVIVDLAAACGGNCALSTPGEDIRTPGGVLILAPRLPAAQVPIDASTLFCRNLEAFLAPLVEGGRVNFGSEDEVVAGARVTRRGEVTHPVLISVLEATS